MRTLLSVHESLCYFGRSLDVELARALVPPARSLSRCRAPPPASWSRVSALHARSGSRRFRRGRGWRRRKRWTVMRSSGIGVPPKAPTRTATDRSHQRSTRHGCDRLLPSPRRWDRSPARCRSTRRQDRGIRQPTGRTIRHSRGPRRRRSRVLSSGHALSSAAPRHDEGPGVSTGAHSRDAASVVARPAAAGPRCRRRAPRSGRACRRSTRARAGQYTRRLRGDAGLLGLQTRSPTSPLDRSHRASMMSQDTWSISIP